MDQTQLFEKVKSVVERAIAEEGRQIPSIEYQSSLINDLGVTSLMFVDLTLALEEIFYLSEFPMQTWIDEQTLLGEKGFRIAALVEKCGSLLNRTAI